VPPNRTSYAVDIVIPCYLEQDVLPITVPAIQNYLRGLAQRGNYKLASCQLILVDDGSSDSTWDAMGKFSSVLPEIAGIKLSRNCGHQSALLAGLAHATADVVISMDADLQDDIHAIGKMLLAYEAGSDLVLGVRSDRTSDTVTKRGTAGAYYKILSLLGVNIVENHADFRLMSKRALAALLLHNEVNLFLRGIIPTLGFKTSIVPYARQSRAAGKTKYTLRKMARLARRGHILLHSAASFRLRRRPRDLSGFDNSLLRDCCFVTKKRSIKVAFSTFRFCWQPLWRWGAS